VGKSNFENATSKLYIDKCINEDLYIDVFKKDKNYYKNKVKGIIYYNLELIL
jgi:hypothetical protein